MSADVKGAGSKSPLPADTHVTSDAVAFGAAIAAAREVVSGLSDSGRLATLCALASEFGLSLTHAPGEGAATDGGPPVAGGPGWTEEFQAQVGLSDALLKAALLLDESKREIAELAQRLERAVEHKSRRLNASEARYARLFGRVKDGVFACDRVGRFLEVNAPVLEHLGYGSKEALVTERTFAWLFANAGLWEDFYARLIEQQVVHNAECELVRRDGGRLDVLVSAALVHDGDGRPVGFEGMWHDMTEQRRLQERLMRAERLEAVNQMIVTCSHELNQPLTVLCNYAQLLIERCETAGGDMEVARAMSEEATRLAGVVAKLRQIREVRSKPYVEGIQMLDLESSTGENLPAC